MFNFKENLIALARTLVNKEYAARNKSINTNNEKQKFGIINLSPIFRIFNSFSNGNSLMVP